MRLTKRYFDVISDTGSYLIAYDAIAHLGCVPLHYRATLSDLPHLRRARFSISGALTAAETFPQPLSAGKTPIECGRRGRLDGMQVKSGAVCWRLDAIGFPVTAGEVSGFGYCETVSLGAAPWTLGLQRIRWGRFVGAHHWAVWNLVHGANPIAFAALDGASVNIEANSDRLDVGAARIELGAVARTVAEGDVIAAELGTLRPLIALLNGPRFRLVQRKTVREARLTLDTGESEFGFVMDETVVVTN